MASEDYEEKKMKAYANRRSILDYGFGVLYLAAGIFVAMAKKLGYELNFLPEPYTYVFGGLFLIYGIFRIYRGYKKNYFR
jgi:uncharacterized membrane protein HdeD (DUF308 family)